MPTVEELASLGIEHPDKLEPMPQDVRIAAEARAARFKKAMDTGNPNAARADSKTTENEAAAKILADKERADKAKADAAKGGSVVDTLLAPVEKKEDVDPLAEFKDDKSLPANAAKMRLALEKTHKEAQEARAEIERMKAELAGKADPKTFEAELAALRKERDELQIAVSVQNPERDPKFRSEFIDGRTKLIDKMVLKTDAGGGKGDELRDALKMPEGKARAAAIKEALSDLEADDRAPIHSLITKLEDLDERKTEHLASSEKNWKEGQAEREKQTAAQRDQAAKELAADFDEVARALPEKFFPLREAASDVKDADAWNTDIRQGKELARKVLAGEVPRKDVAALVLKGVRSDSLLAWGMAQYERANAAEKTAQGYQKASPEMNGNRRPPTENGSERKFNPSQQDLASEFKARFDKAMAKETVVVD
jgi:hypothetical protein